MTRRESEALLQMAIQMRAEAKSARATARVGRGANTHILTRAIALDHYAKRIEEIACRQCAGERGREP